MLPSKKRIQRAGFEEILKKSVKFETGYFIIRAHFPRNGLKSRFSVVISSKSFKKAVDRNLYKRRVYSALEFLQKSGTLLEKPLFLAIFVKKADKVPSFAKIKENLKEFLKINMV